MGLLDQISTAKGDSSANYAKGGRHVVRLTRAYFQDPADDDKVEKLKGGFDGEVLATNNAVHSKGDVVRVNCMWKYIPNDVARMRRGITAAKTAKEGKAIAEATLGLEKGESEDDKAFKARIATEARRLFDPATQPLKGAIVTFVVSMHKGEKGGEYSLFEIEVPTTDDLKAAGLV